MRQRKRYEDDVICGLTCTQSAYEISEADAAGRSAFSDRVLEQVNEYLDGKRTVFDLSYHVIGMDFQKKVWNELTQIPYGETRTYKEIAARIGNPKASRAVGMANHNNPLLLIIPCHRVIGSSRKLTGYAGGLEMKQYLLSLEERSKT